MTVTPIFDELMARRESRPPAPAPRPTGPDDLAGLVEGARQEAVVLGARRVGTLHLLLAVVRAPGEVGRAFGMRGAGPAVLVAAAEDEADTADLPDALGVPPWSAVARTVLRRVLHRAVRDRRPVSPADVAIALLRTGRVAGLLDGLGADLDDLVDVLTVLGGHEVETPVPELGTAPAQVATVRVPVGVPA